MTLKEVSEALEQIYKEFDELFPQTMADKFAKRFNDDGQCRTTKCGRGWLDVLYNEFNAEVSLIDWQEETQRSRIEFVDGSAIVECLLGWDYEGSTPFSFRGDCALSFEVTT